MAYSEKIADNLRQALAGVPNVEEKKMFGGLAFMVAGKMCLTAGSGRIMCRIDPKLHESVVEKEHCQTVVMKGRKYKGYVYVSEDMLNTAADFQYWVSLALDFSKKMQGL